MDTRKKVLYCNLAIIVLCLASIISYFLMPFWKAKVSYTLTAETLESVFPDVGDESEAGDLLANLDFEEIAGEDGITLSLAIALETSDVLSALSAEPTELVENILESNIHNLVNQISEPISAVVKTTVTVVVQTALKEGIKEEVKKNLAEGTTDEQVMQDLADANLTEDYIDEKASQLVDSIYQEGATSETIADATIDIVEETIQIMKESGNPNYADIELTEEAKANLKAELVEQFAAFENENGSIDPDSFTSDFLVKLLKGEEEGSETAAVLATPMSVKPVTAAAEETDPNVELRQLLTEKLTEVLGEAAETIALVIKILACVILFSFAMWLIPILKIALRWKKNNNAIKVGLPIWFGSIPFVYLCLLPTIGLSVAKDALASSGMLGDIDFLSALSISFSSCAIVSFIAGIALAIFVIVYYGKQRKLLKNGLGYVKASAPVVEPTMESEIEVVDEAPTTEEATEVIFDSTDTEE